MVDCTLLKKILVESESVKEKLEDIEQSLENLLKLFKMPSNVDEKELAGLIEELIDDIDMSVNGVKSLISSTLTKAHENKCIEWKQPKEANKV